MSHLLLRADASPTIGVGHVARMVAFAEQARHRGWRVTFSTTLATTPKSAEWFADRLAELGVRLVPPTDPGDTAALAALTAELGAEAVLVDHYDIGEQRADVNAAGAVLVSLEDGMFGRRAADVAVEPGWCEGPRPDDGSAVVLRGPRYTPLREDVLRARESRVRALCARAPRAGGARPRVVVVLGGGAVWRETVTRLLHTLRGTGLPFDAEVAAHGDPDVPEPGAGQRFRVRAPGTGLPRRLATADLAVSAAGVTSLEACCIGVPTALVLLVDNQAAGYRTAVREGFAAGLGTADRLDAARGTLARLLTEPAERAVLAAAASSAVDGRGAARVLDAIEEALP